MNTGLPPGALVVLYLRDSGGDEQELSLAQQEGEIRAWADAHHLVITRVFSDEGASAKSVRRRDAFREMISYFHNDALEAGILVWRSNRFGRNINDSQFYKADLRRRGFKVVSITDNIPDGPAGQLVEFALEWHDQLYLEQLSEDTRRGLRHMLLTYGAVPGTPPRGFKREPVDAGVHRDGRLRIVHRWIPDPEQIHVVQKAFEMRARGETYRHIAEATGFYVAKTSWPTFFRNRLYYGELHFGELVIENYCDPIVDRATWDAANAVGKRRSNRLGPADEHPRRIGSGFLLSGILHCQLCGAPMNGYLVSRQRRDKPERYGYYACSRGNRRHDCPARNIRREGLDEAVIKAVLEHALSIDNMVALQLRLREEFRAAQSKTHETRHELARRLGITKKQISNLAEAISAGGHSKTLLDRLALSEAEESSLRFQLSMMDGLPEPPRYSRVELVDIASQLTADLTGDDYDKKRKTLRALLSRVVALRKDPEVQGVAYYYAPWLCLRSGGPDGTEIIDMPFAYAIKPHKFAIFKDR